MVHETRAEQEEVVLGSIPVHTVKGCVFLLGNEVLMYRHTVIFDYTTFGTLRRETLFQTGPFSMLRF